jgi:hypothetical protein
MTFTETAGLLANIAEFVGLIAIFVTLVYLAIQVRKAQAAAESDSLKASEDAASNWRAGLAQNPQVASLYRRATEDFDSLTPDEQMQANWLFSDLFWVWQGLILRSDQGVLDMTTYTLVEQNVRVFTQLRGVRQWWPSHKVHFSSAFADIVEKCISEAD